MTDGRIECEIVDQTTAIVRMSREDKRNALTSEMSEHLVTTFHQLDARTDVRVIVLTGAGDKAFTAGHDLKSALHDGADTLFSEPFVREFMVPAFVSKPVISAVNGAAYAGGLCLAIASDLRIASSTASFASPGVKLGIVPSGGQLSLLSHLLPPAVAAEMLMMGSVLTADRAERYGFVSEVVASDSLVERACEMAAIIGQMSPSAIRASKRVLRATLTQGPAVADAMEFWQALQAGHGPDVREGLKAFAERRSPQFD